MRSPPAQDLVTESHVTTANVAFAAATTKSLQVPNKDKAADLLHPGEM